MVRKSKSTSIYLRIFSHCERGRLFRIQAEAVRGLQPCSYVMCERKGQCGSGGLRKREGMNALARLHLERGQRWCWSRETMSQHEWICLSEGAHVEVRRSSHHGSDMVRWHDSSYRTRPAPHASPFTSTEDPHPILSHLLLQPLNPSTQISSSLYLRLSPIVLTRTFAIVYHCRRCISFGRTGA